jgi:hypothetical protein
LRRATPVALASTRTCAPTIGSRARCGWWRATTRLCSNGVRAGGRLPP